MVNLLFLQFTLVIFIKHSKKENKKGKYLIKYLYKSYYSGL